MLVKLVDAESIMIIVENEIGKLSSNTDRHYLHLLYTNAYRKGMGPLHRQNSRVDCALETTSIGYLWIQIVEKATGNYSTISLKNSLGDSMFTKSAYSSIIVLYRLSLYFLK